LLTEEFKIEKFKISIEMLEILQRQTSTNFLGALTRDELRLVLGYSKNYAWKIRDENTPEQISEKIDMEKHILKIFWVVSG
jgi:hypothetical protein